MVATCVQQQQQQQQQQALATSKQLCWQQRSWQFFMLTVAIGIECRHR